MITSEEMRQIDEYVDALQTAASKITCREGPFTLDLAKSTGDLHVWHCKACGGTVRIPQSPNPSTVDKHIWAHMRPKTKEQPE